MDREDNWEHGNETNQVRDLDELGRANVAQDLEDLILHDYDGENGLRRLDQVADGRYRERCEMGRFRRAEKMDDEGVSSSNLVSRPSYDYEFQLNKRIGVDGFNNDGYVEDNQSVTLRRLGVREDRLSRFGDLNFRGKEKTTFDRPIALEDSRSSSENRYPNTSLGVNSSSGQYSYLDARFNRPSYQNQYPEPSLMHSRVQEYEGALRSQMLRRGPFRMPPSFTPSVHPYTSGSYRGDDMVYVDQFESYHPDDIRHHQSCPCLHCLNTRQVPQPVTFSDNFSNVSVDTRYNYRESTSLFSPRDYNIQATNHYPLRFRNPLSHRRWSSDVHSDVDGFIRRHPPRVVHSVSVGPHCLPIGSGAPFFICFNCFELLLLPKNVATKSYSQKKVRCGMCSIVIVFKFSNNKLVICDNAEATTDRPVNFDDNSNLSPTRAELYMSEHNQGRTTFSSEDFDNTGYDYESMDRELEQPSPGRGRVNYSSETKHSNSKSTHAIDVEKITEGVNFPREDSKVAYQENKEPPPPAGSSLQEYFEYSNQFHVKKHPRAHENFLPSKIIRQQSSSLSAATETDISSNEFSNTATSFGSGAANRKGRRASDSFFAGIVKKSFKELNRSNQNAEKEKADVTINGHLMPNETIKKAEEVAGPIHSGQYWYDYRAGFWGVMGGPCLGIIPPGIEEFNHPMPEKCAGGNTDIYVNGRELNQKDLSLLKRRGLPTNRNRSYAIEISGRIIDKDTGVELKSLGRLAPTMESLQRGFGMRVRKGAP